MAELTFALEQEEVGAGAERGAEVGAVVHQVAGQALPVEAAHRVGAAGTGSGWGCHQGRDPRLRPPRPSRWLLSRAVIWGRHPPTCLLAGMPRVLALLSPSHGAVLRAVHPQPARSTQHGCFLGVTQAQACPDGSVGWGVLFLVPHPSEQATSTLGTEATCSGSFTPLRAPAAGTGHGRGSRNSSGVGLQPLPQPVQRCRGASHPFRCHPGPLWSSTVSRQEGLTCFQKL